MRKRTRCVRAPLVAVCAGLCVAIPSPLASGAEGAQRGTIQTPALELYALESELAAARARVRELAGEQARLRAARVSVRTRLAVASAAVQSSQRTLERVVRDLYATGDADPLAIVLGAASVADALDGIDALERSALQSRSVGEQARRARLAAARLYGSLAARGRELDRIAAAALQRQDELAAAVVARRVYVAELARRESAASVAAAQRQARAAAQRSVGLTANATGSSAQTVVAATETESATQVEVLRSVRRLTVSAVAYSLPGRTASGLPVGRGVVAVDPTVIPLGTRLYVPGYGPAVAADVGTAVRGPIIDLWFPTLAEARAWGRRTVTITLL